MWGKKAEKRKRNEKRRDKEKIRQRKRIKKEEEGIGKRMRNGGNKDWG